MSRVICLACAAALAACSGGDSGAADAGRDAKVAADSGLSQLRVWVLTDTHFDNSTIAGLVDDEGKTYPGYDWPEVFGERLDKMEGKYDLAVLTGDIVHYRDYEAEMKTFEQILTDKGVKEKWLPVLGNHDTLHGSGGPLAGAYYVEHIAPVKSTHFTRQLGNVLFIVVGDEGCTGPDGYSYGLCDRSTWEWFDKTVADNTDKLLVAASHEHLTFEYDWAEGLPYSEDFKKTLESREVAVWLYGHTHTAELRELSLDGGNKTLFANAGKWECSPRACLIRTDPSSTWAPHTSLLLTFTAGSKEVSVDQISHLPGDETTPVIKPASSFTLNKAFEG